jgi:D-galactose 1-dehydrogenase
MRSNPLKLGIIGFGMMGRIHALALQAEETGIMLAATADSNTQGLDITPHFTDYHQLLNRKDIDAVSICTPPNTHFELAMKALQNDKHVLLEKPPTLTLEQLELLQETAQTNGLTLYTSFHTRHRPEVRRAVEELQNKAITKIDVIYHEKILDMVPSDHWMLDPDAAGGGVLIDNTINAISILRDLVPAQIPLTVQQDGVILELPATKRVEFVARVPFLCGTNKSMIYSDWNKDNERVFTIYTEDGTYRLDIVHSTFYKDGELLYAPHKKIMMEDEYAEVYREFAQYIENKLSLVRKDELNFVLDCYQTLKKS